MVKRIQRLQNTAVGYVLMCYSNEKDAISLNWLRIIELIDFEISYKVIIQSLTQWVMAKLFIAE